MNDNTYWMIFGLQWHKLEFIDGEEIDQVGLECGPFSSKESAQEFLSSMPTDPRFCEEQLIDDQTVMGHELEHNPLRHKEYVGPIIPDTLRLVKFNLEI